MSTQNNNGQINNQSSPQSNNKKESSGFSAIVKKEFARFFTDKRMVLTTILLPGLMIFALYSFMGTAMESMFSVDEEYKPVQYVVNLPTSMDPLFSDAGISFEAATSDDVDSIKERLSEQEVDLLIVFPENFDETLAHATENIGSYSPPPVEIYYNSAKVESSSSYGTITALLDEYKNAQFNLFSVNTGQLKYDLVTERDASSSLFATMLPMLMMIFIYTGCVGIAPESIAGEKERGTIATLLVTPLKRWELALGKIVSISCIALLSGISSFIGTILALPAMMGGSGGNSLSIDIYGIQEYLLLLAVISSTVLLFVGLISIISAFAKSIKEASTAVMPLMIIIMLVAVSAMFSTTAQTDSLFYLIPAYNSVQCMVGIFTFSYDPAQIAITVATNLVVTGVCVFVLTKMFNSEKIMFAR